MAWIDEFLKKINRTTIDGKTYIEWYRDDKYGIYFSTIPDIDNKVINKKLMTKEEIKAAKKKPLYLKNTVDVVLFDYVKNKKYEFTIKKDYDYDGATIPKFFIRLIGSKEDIRFKIASLIHDVLCENHHYVDNDRYFADKIFERCLYVSDTCAFIRWLMFHSMDNFQKFCGWNKERACL